MRGIHLMKSLMIKPRFLLTLVMVSMMLFAVHGTTYAQEALVNIPDANLRAAIESALDKTTGAPISKADMTELTRLEVPEAGVRNLTGLEYATNVLYLDLNVNEVSDLLPLEGLTNLEVLHLWRNSVSDLSPLAELTDLTRLYLGTNSVSDLSPLEGLTNLEHLFLDGNGISDLSPLAGLTKLKRLALSANSVSDLSPLTGLTSLTWMRLAKNNISDISSLSGLTQLTRLWLNNNQISDISALAGLTQLTELGLWQNPISDISPVSGLTNLTWMSFGGNRITDISAVAGLTKLEVLWFDYNTIADISAVASLTNLDALHLEHNDIADLSPLVANTGLGEGDHVDVRENPLNHASINTHIPALRARGVEVLSSEEPTMTPVVQGDLSSSYEAVYWLDHADNRVVRSVDLGNTVPRSHRYASNEILDFSIDVSTGTIYWLEFDYRAPEDDNIKIMRANLNGTDARELAAFGRVRPFRISSFRIDVRNQKMYWSDYGEYELVENDEGVQYWEPAPGTGKIMRANLDGTHIQEFLTGLNEPQSLAIDVFNERIYWRFYANPDDWGIRSCSFDGSDFESIKYVGGRQIAVDAFFKNKLIWLDSGAVIQSDLDGQNVEHIVTGLDLLAGDAMALDRQAGTIYYSSYGIRDTLIDGRSASIPVLQIQVAHLDASNNVYEIATVTAPVRRIVLGPSPLPREDVDRDGDITMVDIGIVVQSIIDERFDPRADVNGDGEVNVEDFAAVVGAFVLANPAAPSIENLTPHEWLQVYAGGKELHLLDNFVPNETMLLANYPNPFNPETWIPYRLSDDTDVTLTIHAETGELVRTFDLGYLEAGNYIGRDRAVYWDGRNQQGEPVASGVYFYQLRTESAVQVRRMAIVK